ncbi:hypothetical protein GCM10025866_25410 [Naasia aerilata]|uniref:Uncharacterized protein n=1 Tax=Naasia aerilata TaxID=1162966 RepID=A0ABN6XNR2_9MICO|nr:hypothetical protein GCM10025866_25410 [Naasia aerilata]
MLPVEDGGVEARPEKLGAGPDGRVAGEEGVDPALRRHGVQRLASTGNELPPVRGAVALDRELVEACGDGVLESGERSYSASRSAMICPSTFPCSAGRGPSGSKPVTCWIASS